MKITVHRAARLLAATAGLAAGCALAQSGTASSIDHRIALPSGWFTPQAGKAEVAASVGTGIYLVQLDGTTTDARLDGLRRLGATPLQYVEHDAWLVLADAKAGTALARAAQRGESFRYSAPLTPAQKLTPELANRLDANPQDLMRVTVVVAGHAGVSATQNRIRAMDRTLGKRRWVDLRGMWSLDVEIPAAQVTQIAALGDVLTIGITAQMRYLDEKQTQTLAGKLNAAGTGPLAPGYRAWLESLGFSTNPADYPLLGIVDDGIGDGTTVAGAGDESLTVDGAGVVSRVVAALSCSDTPAVSSAGHGHLIATIAAGYDDRTGFPYRDPEGFRRREGVNPWARLANVDRETAVGGGPNCDGTWADVIPLQARNGVRISSNSWGSDVLGTYGAYDANARAYDIGTRDADPALPGNQPMTFVFGAGNYGPRVETIASPGTAKNVITVGASENNRVADENGPWQTWACDNDPAAGDSVMDIAKYSSRGPAVGGRAKPELIAPGSRVYGSASTAPDYNGMTVCMPYYPAGQTEITAADGTSQATPAVSAAATLVWRWLDTHYGITDPSPALLKSYLVAHPTYLTGNAANDTLPSPNQGYGMPNLAAAFSAATSRLLVDQTQVFGAVGETYEIQSAVANDGEPVRIVLTWTDAPGAVNAVSPNVNDLDLEVTAGGASFRGNRFAGAWSVSGGVADAVNNTEVVYVPAGVNGPIRITVTARNIAGDGVPGNDDDTDQDFALVCVNCMKAPDFTIASNAPVQEVCGGGGDWPIEVGALGSWTGNVTLTAGPDLPPNLGHSFFLQSSGAPPFPSIFDLMTDSGPLTQGDYTFHVLASDGNVTRSLALTMLYSDDIISTRPQIMSPQDGATEVPPLAVLAWNAVPDALTYTVEIDDDPQFLSIDRQAVVTGTQWNVRPILDGSTRYWWRVRANNHCHPSPTSAIRSFTTQAKYCATPGATIPGDGRIMTARIVLPPLGTLNDLDVAFATDHSWIGDLTVKLAKGEVSATLLDRPGEPAVHGGCSGHRADLVFDDEGTAGTAEDGCANAEPAYTPGGRYTPNQPLSVFDGLPAGGTYEVFLSDAAMADDGRIESLCLLPTVNAASTDSIFADGFE